MTGHVRLTRLTPEDYVSVLGPLPTGLPSRTISHRRVLELLLALPERQALTSAVIGEVFGVSASYAAEYLRNLEGRGFVVRRTSNRTGWQSYRWEATPRWRLERQEVAGR